MRVGQRWTLFAGATSTGAGWCVDRFSQNLGY